MFGEHSLPADGPSGVTNLSLMSTPVSRYSLPEYERRFLLEGIPSDADRPRMITDRYVLGTRLRLRVVVDRDTGEALQCKVGHKIRPEPADPTTVLHTSLYLDHAEMEVLEAVDAVEITRTRLRWSHDGYPAAVDAYHDHLEGFVVAELNFENPESLHAYEPTRPLGAEITHIEELTGPNLASLDPARLAELTVSD